jgi:N-acetylglucosamine malate deacetylase 1
MKKILFLFAHPDDEAFAAAGTIKRLTEEGNDVTVVSMCNGARPGAEHVATSRQLAFKKSCELLGATSVIHNNPDLTMSYTDIVNFAVSVVNEIKPDTVFTNAPGDINADHRHLAEGVLVACRPKPDSTVRRLYVCEVVGSSDWKFGTNADEFRPNTFIDISDYVDVKEAVIKLYNTEIYSYPDARSYEAALVRAADRGCTVGRKAAEAFQLVFNIQ